MMAGAIRARLLLLTAPLLLSGCGSDDISVYEVPAETHSVADDLGEIREYQPPPSPKPE